MSRDVTIAVPGESSVSGRLLQDEDSRACLVLAHGAGAGMRHPFMEHLADALLACAIATLRFQFPYMEKGSKRPDRPPVATATVRAAVETAAKAAPDLPLVAGGKSFGGRMTSLAQAEAELPGIRGLVFVGFPLHPAKQPSVSRAAHLAAVALPMLFLQGARDALADADLIAEVTRNLGPRAKLETIPDADHSFHVPKRSGRTDDAIIASLARTIADWTAAILG